jgi:hypothetical protein
MQFTCLKKIISEKIVKSVLGALYPDFSTLGQKLNKNMFFYDFFIIFFEIE